MEQNKFSEAFERMTVNQMVTLVELHRLGHTHEVARLRNRDLSSILKQLETLNNTFVELCGERLLDTDTGRGKPVQFTQTGEEIVKQANKFLESSLNAIDKRRREVGRKLTAASTTGMLSVISKIWQLWQERARGAFELHLTQIRTYEVSKYLSEGRVDLVFAGIIDHKDAKHDYEEFEFLNWSKGHKIVLLANHTRLPSDPVKLGDITNGNISMVLASHGIMRQFANLVFQEDLQRVNTVASIDDLYFGLGLLRNNIYQASMLTIETLADQVIKDQAKSGGVRFHKYVVKGLEDYTISDGVFRRRVAGQFAANHPINVCWSVIKDEAEKLSKEKG